MGDLDVLLVGVLAILNKCGTMFSELLPLKERTTNFRTPRKSAKVPLLCINVDKEIISQIIINLIMSSLILKRQTSTSIKSWKWRSYNGAPLAPQVAEATLLLTTRINYTYIWWTAPSNWKESTCRMIEPKWKSPLKYLIVETTTEKVDN